MEEKSFGPVRFIPGKKRGKYPYCRSVYIEGAGVLIDPASDRERLVRLREEKGGSALWLTHWHEDHISCLDLFENVPLRISKDDAEPLADLDGFLDWYGMTGEFRDVFREVMVSGVVEEVPDSLFQINSKSQAPNSKPIPNQKFKMINTMPLA